MLDPPAPASSSAAASGEAHDPETRQRLPPCRAGAPSAMNPFASRRLSCGIVLLTDERQLLLCHVTGQNHWDLPKGGIDAGESPVEAALRETREETGLRLEPASLVEIGRLRYTPKKDLHLFAARSPRLPLNGFRCETYYVDRARGRRLPEMDGYGWFDFSEVRSLCTPNMAAVLTERVDVDALLASLRQTAQPVP